LGAVSWVGPMRWVALAGVAGLSSGFRAIALKRHPESGVSLGLIFGLRWAMIAQTGQIV
jgi:hypothetical protein